MHLMKGTSFSCFRVQHKEVPFPAIELYLQKRYDGKGFG